MTMRALSLEFLRLCPLSTSLYPSADRDTLESQWMALGAPLDEICCHPDLNEDITSLDIVHFWGCVLECKTATGNRPFEQLAKFALRALTIPVSIASVERVFSFISALKTKIRNRMQIEMLEALLRLRVHHKAISQCCKSFQVTQDMLNTLASSDLSSDAEEEYMYAQSLSLRRLDDLRLNLLDEKLGSLGVAEPILFEKSLRGIAQYIKEGKAKKIITMAGAGISFTSGIPDFWSPKYGLYDTLENPQALFDIDVFRRKPRPFFKFARQLFEESFQPTFSHYFIRLLYEKGLLLRHYTQNIDNLERVAGIAEEVLIETRGTFLTSHCLKCRTEYQFEWMKENLPKRYHTYVNEDLSQADLLIIMGSSLLSHPFAFLVTKVRKDCPRLVINQEPPLGGDRIMAFLGMESGEDFTASSKRDVTVIGSCDRSCKQLADNLGWLSELIQLRHHRSREMAAREGVTRIKARGYKTAEKEEENNRIQI